MRCSACTRSFSHHDPWSRRPAGSAPSRLMKLLLVGYGKMGRLVEELAAARQHEIAGRIDAGDEAWAPADVAIDFSTADALALNFPRYVERRLPVVIGTTGWGDRLSEYQAGAAAVGL